MLRLNGYSTGVFGKNHETAPWEVSVSGPFDRWPTHSGFDKFYGFIGGETEPVGALVYRRHDPGRAAHDPNYHFMTDMTNQAIGWISPSSRSRRTSPSSRISPPVLPMRRITCRRTGSRSSRASSTAAGTRYREETFARQKKLGIVPASAKLANKPTDIKDWDKLTPDEQRLFARQMEVYRGVCRVHRYTRSVGW